MVLGRHCLKSDRVRCTVWQGASVLLSCGCVHRRQKQEEAVAAHKRFVHRTGDHLTMASVYAAFTQVRSNIRVQIPHGLLTARPQSR